MTKARSIAVILLMGGMVLTVLIGVIRYILEHLTINIEY